MEATKFLGRSHNDLEFVCTYPWSWGQANFFLKVREYQGNGLLFDKVEVWWACWVVYDDLSIKYPRNCLLLMNARFSILNRKLPLQSRHNVLLCRVYYTGNIDCYGRISGRDLRYADYLWFLFAFFRNFLYFLLASLLRGWLIFIIWHDYKNFLSIFKVHLRIIWQFSIYNQ